MRKMYTLVKEPSKEVYSKVLFYSLNICTKFLLVIRPTVFLNSSGKNIIDDLMPYFIEKDAKSEWPGTRLLSDTALVSTYNLNMQSAKYLSQISSSLYSWLQPNFPEDLCLLRENGEPWLVTISHERDAYLLISEEEKDNLLMDIPELVLEEDLTN